MRDHFTGLDTLALTFRSTAAFVPRQQLDPIGTVVVRHGTGMLEASLPRLLTGTNAQLLPLGRTGEGVDALLALLRGLDLADEQDLDRDQVRVKRIDVGRDFYGIPMLASHLDALSLRGTRGQTKVRVDKHRSGVTETLRIGAPTSWSATLYDKDAERGVTVPQNQLRFEARLLQPRMTGVWARKNGGVVNVVSDLQPLKLELLAKGTFQTAGFDAAVWTDESLEHTVAQMGLKPAQIVSILGFDRLRGTDVLKCLSRSTAKHYEGLLKAAETECAVNRPNRLDWNRGFVGTTLA